MRTDYKHLLLQLHECLAQLITENLEVTRWLFKLDDEYDGRGIAYIDIGDHLHCYQWALKEAARYGEKWKKKWAQVHITVMLLQNTISINCMASSITTFPHGVSLECWSHCHLLRSCTSSSFSPLNFMSDYTLYFNVFIGLFFPGTEN